MDCKKVGQLIYELRKERNMTQRALAEQLHISDKTVSKWERGLGCPDVSLLGELSNLFGVGVEKILEGDLHPNEKESGNMKLIKFYSCPYCGNVLTGTGDASLSCCGRILEPLQAEQATGEHNILVEGYDDEYYVTLQHEMSKEHYISFAALVTFDSFFLIKMYPEQNASFYLPKLRRYADLYVYCTKHGLFKKKLTMTSERQFN